MACEANTALLNCVDVRALPRAFTTAGRRSSLKQVNGDWLVIPERFASTGEVKELRREVRDMKELVADLALENRVLKKSMIGPCR